MAVSDLPNRNININQELVRLGGYGWINTNIGRTVMGIRKKYQKMNILKKIDSALQDKGDREGKQFWTFRRMA